MFGGCGLTAFIIIIISINNILGFDYRIFTWESLNPKSKYGGGSNSKKSVSSVLNQYIDFMSI